MRKHYFTINEYTTNVYKFNATEDDEKVIKEIGLEKYLKDKLHISNVFKQSLFVMTEDFIDSEQETIQEY